MTRRRGFTLIEILVVMAILVALTVFVVMAINPSPSSKMREAGRMGQASILGARDRALHANDRRGFRLLIDPNNSNPTTGVVLATGFVYVQPIPFQTYPIGSFSLERPDTSPPFNSSDSDGVVIVHGQTALPSYDWWNLAPFFSNPPKIRIPSGPTGQWYTFNYTTTGPYALTQANPDQILVLTSSFADTGAFPPAVIAYPVGSAFSSCDIEIRNELLPNHQPIYLPSGVVIDMRLSRPTTNATMPFPDIMFSPRGTVVPTGVNAAISPVYLFLRDVRDALNNLDPAATNLQGDQLILTIFPQTGHVQAYPVDTTDAIDNSTGAAGQDNKADDPYRFAKAGQGAAG